MKKKVRDPDCVLTLFSGKNFGTFLLGFYSAEVNLSYLREMLIYSGIVTASHTCTLKLD